MQQVTQQHPLSRQPQQQQQQQQEEGEAAQQEEDSRMQQQQQQQQQRQPKDAGESQQHPAADGGSTIHQPGMLAPAEAPNAGHDPGRLYCPYPGCRRSYMQLCSLRWHYRASPQDYGHSTELPFCPRCHQALHAGKRHMKCPGHVVGTAPQPSDEPTYSCPYTGCNRTFVDFWRLKAHYKAPPDANGPSGGHGMNLLHCPKCSQLLEEGPPSANTALTYYCGPALDACAETSKPMHTRQDMCRPACWQGGWACR